MFLNTITSSYGARPSAKRVGRGIGSTLGKTCGRGHKGQKARAGGFHKTGFEGGQMPLQRRLPKVGFRSQKKQYVAEVRLSELDLLDSNVVNLEALIEANIVAATVKFVKIISSGTVQRSFDIDKNIKLTTGAKLAIENAGGKVEV